MTRCAINNPEDCTRCTCGELPSCTREGCARTVDCSHIACPLRRTLTVGIPQPHGRPRLTDEYVPPDER